MNGVNDLRRRSHLFAVGLNPANPHNELFAFQSKDTT
jgi:hypothetical protein